MWGWAYSSSAPPRIARKIFSNMTQLLVCVTTTIVALQLGSAQQNDVVTENIGFGQVSDTGKEGITDAVKILLEPKPTDVNVSGRIVPLSLSQYMDYNFTTPRTVPQSVQDAINAIVDPAEYEDDRKDFNNTVITLTIVNGTEFFDLDTSTLIIQDNVNEAEEQFILVLELDQDGVVFDEEGGILVFTILDDNPIFLIFNVSANTTFDESSGEIANSVKIQKQNGSPATEVDIPIQVLIQNRSATVGEDIKVDSIKTYMIDMNDIEVLLDPITIVNDMIPETNEEFTLSLMMDPEADTLNVSPLNSIVTMTIIDNDEAQVSFTQARFNVTEGKEQYVEVCITLNDVLLDLSLGEANFTITTLDTMTNNDAQNSDYDPTPTPGLLTIRKDQERDCSNITILDDTIVEEDEEFGVAIATTMTTFTAGVNIVRNQSTVVIEDDDGAVVGFNTTNHTATEGESVLVCVTISSPNASVLSMSSVLGEFTVTESSAANVEAADVEFNTVPFVLDSTNHGYCFDVTLVSDGLVEGTEIVTLRLEQNPTFSGSFGIRDVSAESVKITVRDEDFAVLGFSQPTYTINEQDGNSIIDVCVNLINGTISRDITITYTFDAQGSATQDHAFDSMSGSFMTGNVSVCHMLTVIDNNVAEPDGTLVVTISNSSLMPANTLLNERQSTITIISDDTLRVSMDITTSNIDEGGTAAITVSYSGMLHQGSTVRVSVTAQSDTATVGEDFDLVGGGSLTLSDTNQQMILNVRVHDDNLLEDKVERFSISIALDDDNDVKATIDTPQRIDVTIQDDEQAIISFEHVSYTINEGEASTDSAHSFYVVLENFDMIIIQSPVTIVVHAEINMDTSNATIGIDYEPVVIDRITFREDNYETGSDIRIEIVNDRFVEGHEVIHLTLTQPTVNYVDNPNGAILGSNPNTQVIITNDDYITVGFDVNSTDSNGTEGEAVSLCIQSYNGVLGPNITLDYLIDAPREMSPLPLVMDTAIATPIESTTLDDGDYVRTQTRVSLNATNTSACVKIKLIDDNIVEMTEVFLVQVEQVISSDDLVFGLDPEYTEIKIIDNDEILMGFERTEYEFNESASSLPDSVYIVRENPVNVSSEFDIIVLLQPQSTATDGDDFSVPRPFNVIVTFSGTDDRQPFPLDILPDMVGEGDETIILLITTPGDLEGVIPGDNRTTTITIVEDDFIQYRYDKAVYSFGETDEITQVCVRIVSGVFIDGGYLTLVFNTLQMTASAGDDYDSNVSPTNFNLTNDTRIECINVTIMADTLVEGAEEFDLYFETVFYGSYSANGSNSTRITIRDSNVAQVGFQLSLYTVVEGEEMIAKVCVAVLNGQLTDVVSLNYSLSSTPQTATENKDYGSLIVPNSGMLNLTNSSMCHEMVIFDDIGVEPPETFTVSITATGPTPEFISLFDITLPETTVQIIDNDSLSIGFEEIAYNVIENVASIEVCLMFRGPLKNDSFVDLAIILVPGDASISDYSNVSVPDTLTLNLSNMRGCVSINITDDNIVEGTEVFEVQFSETDDNQINIAGTNTVPVSIEDDEVIQLEFGAVSYTFSEDSSDAVISIVIANYDEVVIENTVSVTVIVEDPGNTTVSDYKIPNAKASISVGMYTTIVRLDIENDTITEGTEYVRFGMSEGVITAIDSGNVRHSNTNTTVFILDNDDAKIGFSEMSYTTAEGVVSVCVRLMMDSDLLQNDVVIRYKISQTNTTASLTDFVPLQEEGQITSAQTKYCHNITIVDDDLVEAAEQLEVNLLSVFNVAEVQLNPNTTTITIDDDDSVSVGFQKSEYSVDELGSQITVTVTIVREDNLHTLHDFSVMVRLNSATNATLDQDFSLDFDDFYFLPMDTSFNFTVSSLHDFIGEGDEVIVLELVTDVEDNVINVNSDQNMTIITIIEDDMIPVSFTAQRYSVYEGESVSVCVEILSGILPANGSADLLLSIASSTASVEMDYVPMPTPNTGTLNETNSTACFTITTREDIRVEGTEEIEIQFQFTHRFGSFIAESDIDTAIVAIMDDDHFELGFEHSVYVIGEESGIVNDTVHIVKLNDNLLQQHYVLTVTVLQQSDDPYAAELDEDYEFDMPLPLTMTFATNHTRLPVSFTLNNDDIEEGYENFTLQLSYNEEDEDGTVRIMTEFALVSIKDDDVVVIGFEKSAYVVFEGERTEVCVAILDRQLTNDEVRQFSVATTQLTDYAATDNEDYKGILPQTKSISRVSSLRQCLNVTTNDDNAIELPERLAVTGNPISHLIEFDPISTTVWIVDDDSLLLPLPDETILDCESTTEQSTLVVSCTLPSDVGIVELMCSVDGRSLQQCSGATPSTSRLKRDADPHVINITIDLLEYDDDLHILNILGLTQVTEILIGIVEFYGLDAAEPVSIWKDREFIAAIAIAGVAFVILLLLLLAICLLIFYHRKVSKLSKYGLDLRSENEYVGIERNLSYRDHSPVELIDYARQQQPPVLIHHQPRPLSQQSLTSTSAAARPQSQQSHASFSRPLSEASTLRVQSQEPIPMASTFNIPPLPPPEAQSSPVSPISHDVPTITVATGEQTLQEPSPDVVEAVFGVHTDEQKLLASDESDGGSRVGEGRGLKITRRHSVEMGKEPHKVQSRKDVDQEDSSRAATFSGHKVVGIKKSGAYSISHGKELQSKEWEAEMQRELEQEIARERERERARARERRREMEQRERRRERDQMGGREHRAHERREREREREVAKEQRLTRERDTQRKETSETVIESPESFL